MDDECVEELGRPISSLKVTELRDELTRRSLIKTGNKKELTDRLRTAIQRQSSQQPSGDHGDQTNEQSDQQEQSTAIAEERAKDTAEQLSSTDDDDKISLSEQKLESNAEDVSPAQFESSSVQQEHNSNLKEIPTDNSSIETQNSTEDTELMSVVKDSNEEEIAEDALSAQSDSSSVNQKQDSNLKEIPTDNSSIEIPNPSEGAELKTAVERNKDEIAKDVQSEFFSINQEKDSIIKERQSDISSVGKPISNAESKLMPRAKASNESEITSQSSFFLKRGISELRTSGNKEKRRKWTSTSTEKSDSSQGGDYSQKSIITGGISSQKLQELIDEKAVEFDSVNQTASTDVVSIDSIQESKESAHCLEEGQIVDTSGDSKSLEGLKQDLVVEKDQSVTEVDVAIESSQPVSELEVEPSNVLLVQNLVRPFTLMQLKEVLTKHGPIIEDKFWTDKVKSKCCVMYESVEIAQLTKKSLHDQQWPSSNPKTLKVSYSNEESLIKYQKSESTKSVDTSSNLPENGGTMSDQANKSITNRLGERLDDGEEPDPVDQVKKRLGERVTGEVSSKSSNINRDGDNSKPQELDDLFKKTKSVPHLFWLPLTDKQAEMRKKKQNERESSTGRDLSQSRRRSPQRRRSSPRHRSPPRRRSPVSLRRSPVSLRRSPTTLNRSPGPIHLSPQRRRSPGLVRLSPPRRRSPGPIRLSPPRRRSPGLVRLSPPRRRSPGPMRRSPGLMRRSPGRIRHSPGSIRRSPGPVRLSSPRRRSPGPIRRSPGRIRHSPGPVRRSPPLVRRSPAPIRGSTPPRRSPPRKRTPSRRRSPQRHGSPGRTIGYNSEQRQLQRLDRLH